ncbi:MAG: hypothetical protein FJZ59_06945 [Chlamydiae bacterium]|jgi:hypothetical protein|nr:hypothetical protein [Chlamydiota bacterium]
MWKFVLLSFFCISCAERHFSANDFPYHDTGASKPRIAIVPVITAKVKQMPWNLSDELTELISDKFLETKQFYLTKDFSVLGKHLSDLSEINPLIEDVHWLYENASSSEFVVFIELVAHDLVAKKSKIPPQAYTLDMAFRVHVIDIRARDPKVILQELVQESFNISIKINYGSDTFSKTTFFLSPLGSAHTQISKRVAKQIQEYILLARI